jgi:NADH:ubiquinone oxidoreductase subunit F (NADH-binding)
MSSAPETAGRPAAPEGLPRLLAGIREDGRPTLLGDHVRRWGRAPALRGGRMGGAFVHAVSLAGLTGRGGAGFPTARTLEAVQAARGRPVVVANGAEGEPPSGKDAVLLGYLPHLVLDGAVLAAQAVGARQAIVAVARSSREVVAYAIAERRRAGTDAGVELRVAVVPDGFVAGEETALVGVLNGGPPLPRLTPPRPSERGVGGAPTLVQNVETLAQLALIARHGPDWFRSVGTAAEPGSALVTLSGAVRDPGVYEVALGTQLAQLLAQAGGPTDELSAVLVGGYFGAWVPAADALAAPLSEAGLGPLGARALVALPASSCGILETARVARWLAAESAGQCGPCVHGLAAIAADLEQIARRNDADAAARALERRLPQLAGGRGACRHPDGVVRFVASALRVFAAEAELHARHGRCTGRARRPVLRLPSPRPAAVR